MLIEPRNWTFQTIVIKTTFFFFKKILIYFSVKCEIKIISEVQYLSTRGGSRAAAASKMECFLTIVNGWTPLTIITKHSILDVAAALSPPLLSTFWNHSAPTSPMVKCKSRSPLWRFQIFAGYEQPVVNPLMPGGNEKVTLT